MAKFMPIVEMIARKETKGASGKILNYDELVNTGLIAVNKLIETAKVTPDTTYNSSYIAQSVKWAIRDEVRSRQGWYGVKRKAPEAKDADPTETTEVKSFADAQKAVFESIMSVESMAEDVGFSPSDPNSPEHLEHLELLEMKKGLMKAVSKLPDNLQQVIEMRFYKEMSGNEVADTLGVTASRVSHMIREAVKKLRVLMVAQGYDES